MKNLVSSIIQSKIFGLDSRLPDTYYTLLKYNEEHPEYKFKAFHQYCYTCLEKYKWTNHGTGIIIPVGMRLSIDKHTSYELKELIYLSNEPYNAWRIIQDYDAPDKYGLNIFNTCTFNVDLGLVDMNTDFNIQSNFLNLRDN